MYGRWQWHGAGWWYRVDQETGWQDWRQVEGFPGEGGHLRVARVPRPDGSIMQMEAFVANVIDNRVDTWITKEGFYASIATLMGYEAMKKNEIVFWPENLII